MFTYINIYVYLLHLKLYFFASTLSKICLSTMDECQNSIFLGVLGLTCMCVYVFVSRMVKKESRRSCQ